jgi:archaeal flagellar protein FlaJ
VFFNKRQRLAVWITSAAVGFLVALLPLIAGLYVPVQPYLIPLTQEANNLITLGMLIVITFPAIVEYSNYVWLKQVEASIPRLLRDISESIHSGVTLPKAVEAATAKGYGPLSKELEHVVGLFVLGNSWEDAVMSLTKRIKSPMVARFATILVEANESGGKISDVLDTSVELFSNLEQYKEEQQNNMKPYIYTIYAAIMIFLVISLVVLTQFLGPLASSADIKAGVGNAVSVLDINYYVSVLFWASVVESLFAGLIAGKIGDRQYLSGLRHSSVLLVATLLFFNLLGGFM